MIWNKHNYFLKTKTLFIIFFLSTVLGCDYDFDNLSKVKAVETDFNTRIPLAQVNGKIWDFFKTVKQDQLQVDKGDSSIYIYAKRKLELPNSDDYLSAQLVDKSTSVNLNIGAISALKGTTVPAEVKETLRDEDRTINTTISADAGAIDSALLNDGSLKIAVELTDLGNSYVTVTASLPNLKTPEKKSTVITGDIGQPLSTSLSINLKGSTLVNSPSATSGIELPFTVETTLTIPKGTMVGLNPAIKVTVSIKDVEHKIVFADIASKSINPGKPEIISFSDLTGDLSKNGFDFDLKFTNPQLKIKTKNSYGVPFGITLNNVSTSADGAKAISLKNKSNSVITLSVSPATYNAKDQNITPIETVQTIDKTNSNVADLFAKIPESLQVGFTAEIDPKDTRNNFFSTNTDFSAEVEFKVPFEGIWNASITKSIPQPGNSKNDIEESLIEYIKLDIAYSNEIPLEIKLSLREKGKTEEILEITLEKAELKKGIYTTKRGTTTYEMDGKKAKNMLSVTELEMDVTLSSGGKSVEVKANQKFTMDWVFDIKMNEYKFSK